MKLENVKKIAQERGLKIAKMKKNDLVRNIQLDEGNNDCYNTGSASTCGQMECLWRKDCR